MLEIGTRKYEQIVVVRHCKEGSLITADSEQEVIAVISDDGDWIVKNGFEIRAIPVPDNRP